MDARNRLLPAWFERVEQKQIELPRFQRFEAWGPNEISDLVETVLRRLPAGAALILEVADKPPFHSRSLVTAPSRGERTTELLLDGQQRMTALWRSLMDTYEDRTYFVVVDPEALEDSEAELVVSQSRWVKKGKRFPMWADEPKRTWERGLIPLRLLRPGDISKEIEEWVDEASGEDHKVAKEVNRPIQSLRERVAAFNLPFLALPSTTKKEVALNVFLKMNTSSVRLSTFDIIVAQVEGKTGESLHGLVAALREEVPEVDAYGQPEKLVLDTAALHQDRSPSQSGYWNLDLDRVVAEWETIIESVRGAISLFEEQKIFDEERLPTSAALSVVAGLWPTIPTKADAHDNARTLLRKYTWRAFLTSRYEQAAATAAFADFRGLRDVLLGAGKEAGVPILDDAQFPRPEVTQLVAAGWPKARGILSRGILALSLRTGARDIADGTFVSRAHVRQREYHHLFPAALLRDAGLSDGRAFRALNCALVTWKTNRTIGAKSPDQYLRARADAATLGEPELRRRLASHLIPTDELLYKPGGISVKDHYEAFIEARAALISKAVDVVWQGRELDLSEVKVDP